jgi:chorismate mutase/prephenate dehydratase
VANEPADVARLRKRIDALDRQIVGLLNERASLALEIEKARASLGQSRTRDAAREREVLDGVVDANTGPLPDGELLGIYRQLIAATRRLQAAHRDGILPASQRDADSRQDPTRR